MGDEAALPRAQLIILNNPAELLCLHLLWASRRVRLTCLRQAELRNFVRAFGGFFLHRWSQYVQPGVAGSAHRIHRRDGIHR